MNLAALALGAALLADPEPCPPAPPCPPCPVCPAAAPAPPPSAWTGSVGLGVVAVTGNARSVTATLNAAVEHKGERWILGGRLFGIYGQSRLAGTDTMQTSAEAASLFLRADYRLRPELTTYALAGVETDHPKSIEVRYSGEAGVSYAWLDWTRGEQKLFLRTDLGFRLSEEYRFQYLPTAGPVTPRDFFMAAPRVGVVFRYELSKSVLFTQGLEVLPNVTGDSRVLANSLSKLSAKLFGPVAFGIGYVVNYDSAPPEPKIPWDTTLSVTLDWLL